MGAGGLTLGGKGRGDGSRRKGIVHLWSVHCVPFAGGTMSPFTHRPPSSLLSLLPRRVVEASTLQQERLQAIAVSPCAPRARDERAGPRAGVPTSPRQCPHVCGQHMEQTPAGRRVLGLGLRPGVLLWGCQQRQQPELLWAPRRGRGSHQPNEDPRELGPECPALRWLLPSRALAGVWCPAGPGSGLWEV